MFVIIQFEVKHGENFIQSYTLIVRDPSNRKLDMSRIKIIYLDATFAVTPNPFVQLFTIMAEIDGTTVLLGHAFMSKRTTGCYYKVLEALQEEYPGLKPGSIQKQYGIIFFQILRFWPRFCTTFMSGLLCLIKIYRTRAEIS